jgi:sugar O-acyltransferase (sialic acid O-acetyltransferase NeuD family)
MKRKLLIVGAGSVGKFIAYNLEEFTQEFEIMGFLDDDVTKHKCSIAGYPVLGPVSTLSGFSGKGVAIVLGIAFPELKIRLFNKYKHLTFDFPSFISKKSWVSEKVSIGKGCIIYPGTSINYECAVNDFVVINMNCAIGHNCSVGSFSSLAPGVNFSGFTRVGKCVEVGIGVTTIQNVVIHDNAILGGQAMILKEVLSGDIVGGIPARSLKKL